MDQTDQVLGPNEVEFFIETMRRHSLEELGSKTWIDWHERLQKLNQEAIIQASAMKEESVIESFTHLQKVFLIF